MSGSLCLLVALICLAGLGIAHKIADYARCRPGAVNVTIFLWAGVVLACYTFIYKVRIQGLTLFPPFTPQAVAVACVAGLFACIAILTFQTGIRYGRISTSWLVINLSSGFAAILSLVVYREWKQQVSWKLPAGLVLVVISVFMLWLDKKVEIERGEEPVPQAPLAGDDQGKKGN